MLSSGSSETICPFPSAPLRSFVCFPPFHFLPKIKMAESVGSSSGTPRPRERRERREREGLRRVQDGASEVARGGPPGNFRSGDFAVEVRGRQRPPSYQSRADRRSRDRERPRRRDASRGRSPRSVSPLPLRQGGGLEGDSSLFGDPRTFAPEPGAKFFDKPASSEGAFNVLNLEGATSSGLPPLTFGARGDAAGSLTAPHTLSGSLRGSPHGPGEGELRGRRVPEAEAEAAEASDAPTTGGVAGDADAPGGAGTTIVGVRGLPVPTANKYGDWLYTPMRLQDLRDAGALHKGQFIRAFISPQPGLDLGEGAIGGGATFFITASYLGPVDPLMSKGHDLGVYLVSAQPAALYKKLTVLFPRPGNQGFSERRAMLHLCGVAECAHGSPATDGRSRLHAVAVQAAFKGELTDKIHEKGLGHLMIDQTAPGS